MLQQIAAILIYLGFVHAVRFVTDQLDGQRKGYRPLAPSEDDYSQSLGPCTEGMR